MHLLLRRHPLTTAEPLLATGSGSDRSVSPTPAPLAAALTGRELLLLQLLARGYTSQQMAALLTTTPRLVDRLIDRATHTLGATDRVEAAAMAVRQGLIA